MEHVKYGKCLIGGNNGVDKVSLHSNISLIRLTQNAKLTDLKLITHSPWLLLDSLRSCKKEKNARRHNRHLLRNSLVGNM